MKWIEIITRGVPIIVVILAYFVHLEVRLTKMSNDICWIKRNIRKCPPD